MRMRFKQLFCNHVFIKTGTERDGGFLQKGGEVTGGQLFYRCECKKCNKMIWVIVQELKS